MTKKEALQILAILKAAYPNSYKGMSAEEASGTVSIWHMQFSDMPIDIVLMAIHKLISSSKFPPTVAEVKDKISSLHWEAYEQITGVMDIGGNTNSVEFRNMARIYEKTRDYGCPAMAEPSITLMVQSQYKALGSGE